MTIPTREEHNAQIKKIWQRCIAVAAVCFVLMVGTVITMKVLKYEGKDIVNVQLIFVYMLVPSYVLGYIAPALAVSLMKMTLGVDMSRETSKDIHDFKEDIKPLINDATAVVAEVKPMVTEVRATIDEVKKLFDQALREFRDGNGKLEDRVVTVLRKAIEEGRKLVRDGETELEKLIFDKIERFLAGVFNPPEKTSDGNGEAISVDQDEPAS